MPLINLVDITADQRAQPRSAILVDKVSEYTEDMERGDKFPALAIFFDGERHWLADGFHRYYAAIAAGVEKFECHIKDGGLRDAILFSCSANAAHGLRRTNDDKRRAAAKLLEDEEWAKWSDAEIARHCSVTAPFIGKMRKEVATFSTKTVSVEERNFVSKHGTEAKRKVRRQEPERPVEGEVVAKWLHEIERLVDKMPDPDEAVANFPADQHYLFPVSKLDAMAAWFTAFAQTWRAKIRGKVNEPAG